MTEQEMLDGLRAGLTLIVDRRDEPLLQRLLELESEGKVTSEFVQYDERSSAMKFRWATQGSKESGSR